MLNKSHNITERFPIKVFGHQVGGIDCATDLLDPELLVFLFLLQPEELRFHVFDGAAPTAESQTSCCCSMLSHSVGQTDGLIRAAYHSAVF